MIEKTSLRQQVREAYSAIAEDAVGDVSIPTGREPALSPGCPVDYLDSLPAIALGPFCGFAGEIVVNEPLPGSQRQESSNWFARISGARESGAFREEFRGVGLNWAALIRPQRNARTRNARVTVADVRAQHG